eukprot:TRINITY_DN51412_c0_g1_i1.p1 TRINITY_DN51412_c0_g1~~TRINITY_DN51412_c0_g1_i1.p1  ORF type:complete len:411 (+),score=66.50 TRINITY_DN51412_c0_g1_i1:51-1283(+)
MLLPCIMGRACYHFTLVHCLACLFRTSASAPFLQALVQLKDAYDAVVSQNRVPDTVKLASVSSQLDTLEADVDEAHPMSKYFWRLKVDVESTLKRWQTTEQAAARAVRNQHCRAEQACFQESIRLGILAAFRRGDDESARRFWDEATHLPGAPGVPWPDYDHLVQKVTNHESKNFWEVSEVPLAAALEEAFPEILKELDPLLPSSAPDGFRRAAAAGAYAKRRNEDFLRNAWELCEPEDPDGPRLPEGQPCWEEFMFYAAEATDSKRGVFIADACAAAPRTCAILASSSELTGDLGLGHTGVSGKASFVVLHANSRIAAHCGTNSARLTVHLGLRVPNGTYIQVRGERRSWEAGKALILDDAYVHHVHNPTDEDRVILLAHVWHPRVVEEAGGFRAARVKLPQKKVVSEL